MPRLLMLAVVALTVGAFLSSSPEARETKGPSPYMSKDLKAAGLLYDDWPKLKGVRPGGTHPLYPAGGKMKGPDSWRCSECHGWDYLGKDGRYSGGPHYTGIKGVYGARRETSLALYRALTSSERGHDFSPYLTSYELWALAGFIRDGLIDINLALAPDARPRGDAESGRALYDRACATCHGKDGRKIDMKDDRGVQGVGYHAKRNPQKTLHKIRWGHPGTDMPSALVDGRLSDQDTIDILAYCMKLR